jgi:ketosteroid isomerase-like protein
MSEENVERIKAGFAAHNRGDLDALVEVYDPEAVFETLLLGTHHGNEAVRLIYEENQKTLSGYDVVPVELIDAGDKVVAVAQAVGTGPASQIAVDEPFVFTFMGERCENRPSETGPKPSKRPGCRSRRARDRRPHRCRADPPRRRRPMPPRPRR